LKSPTCWWPLFEQAQLQNRIRARALDLIASEGYSMAFGVPFLKRVIDERIKVPLTLRWKNARGPILSSRLLPGRGVTRHVQASP
jgi:hypothetical protein